MQRGAARFLAITLVAVAVGGFASAAVGGNPGEFDVRGTWATSTKNDGNPTRYHRTLVITEQSDTGDVRGSWDQHGSGATARMTGTVTGSQMRLVNRQNGSIAYVYNGRLAIRDGSLEWSGRWESPSGGFGGDFTARLTAGPGPSPSPKPSDGRRKSASVVICNRDMAASTDDTVLRCTATVTDASGQPFSTAPTGTFTWTTTKGTLSQSSCGLITPQGSTGWCVVTLTASPGVIPIGTAPPVTASYPGDTHFAPSSASPKLFGRPGGYTPSDAYGPACNDAGYPAPTIGCGDPVNPATGNLSLTVVDTIAAGRGPGLGLARTYNAQAATRGQSGRLGVGWSDTYGARLLIGPGKKRTVVLDTGATVPFTAEGDRFTAPAWVTATLTLAANGRYDFTFSNQTTLTFDADGRLLWITDLSDEPVLLSYAADGSLETVADASGRAITFGHDAAGRVTHVTDPATRAITYAYDTAGNLVTVTDVAGAVTRYTYDGQHRLTGITDPIGATATTTYDDQNRVVGQVDPLGNGLGLAYTGAFPDQIVVATDGNGRQTSYEYTGGVLAAETIGLGSDVQSTTAYIYDDRGALTGTVDPGNNLWQYSWDAAGNLLTTTDPLGRTLSAAYDAHGNPTSTTSALGITTRIEYEERAQPVRVIHAVGTPDEAVVSIARGDPLHPSDVTAITDPLGAVTSWEYDAHGNAVRSVEALGGVRRWARDVLGEVTSVTDASGATTTLTRSPRGEITAFIDPLGHVSSATYDANGGVVSMTDALGQTTTLRTDLAGRAVALELADGTSQSAGRDAVGALVGQTNGLGATSTRTYDAQGRLTTWADAVGGAWQVAYDAIGNVGRVTDPTGTTTEYAYDATGQLTGVSYSDGTPAVTYTYDADGRRTSMTDGMGTSTYEWDARSRLIRHIDGAGHSVTSTYDVRGGLTRMVYPDGLTVEHDYDPLGRLTVVRDGLGHVNRFSYDADGRLVESKLGNGVTTDLAYDANGWIASMTSSALGATAPFASFGYQRDAGGRPVVLTDQAGTRNATFDVRGRLTGLGTDSFGLDAVGNLTDLRSQALAYDIAGRLRFAVGQDMTAFAYDPAGRRIGRLGGIDGPAGYTYDAAGIRTPTALAGRQSHWKKRTAFTRRALSRRRRRRPRPRCSRSARNRPGSPPTPSLGACGPSRKASRLLTR